MEKTIIIGGGITGLVIAYNLRKKGLNPLVIEAGNRLGGRIYTKKTDNHEFELGATWVFDDPVLKELCDELSLTLYPQYLNGDALIKYQPSTPIQKSPTNDLMNDAVYHKIEGGTGALIKALSKRLDASRIFLQAKVSRLAYKNDSITLTLDDGSELIGSQVILAIPPKSIWNSIKISPRIPGQEVLQETHTWMGESSKFTIVLKKDYWRINSLSGFVYSNYGLIREIQDHNTPDGKTFRLLGFMQPDDYLLADFVQRKTQVLNELEELFNIKEEDVLAYDDFLWGEHYIDQNQQNFNYELMPHQNNGHTFYRTSHFDNHLFFAGAETSSTNPGYMEGAVKSAYRVIKTMERK